MNLIVLQEIASKAFRSKVAKLASARTTLPDWTSARRGIMLGAGQAAAGLLSAAAVALVGMFGTGWPDAPPTSVGGSLEKFESDVTCSHSL